MQAKRPRVKGKFVFIGDEKFYFKGVTYGTFRPDADGNQFPSIEVIDMDFRLMQIHGINALRTYTPPPLYLLDLAEKYGLKVMVGLPWEQHINFLESRERINDILSRIANYVKSCQQHNAILCYTIGNEIPSPIVRMLGRRKTEDFLFKIYSCVKSIDNEALVTYVNYPTTEYLELPFLDFVCFNVYLETKEKLYHYLQRLHNLAGDKPLVLAEIGLDSNRNGLEKQAEVLNWQIRTVFERGCAGAFVFAWTDEWWRGGYDIEDWDFGLVDRHRNPKPALYEMSRAFSEVPLSSEKNLPLISVVICTYNGSLTIRDTLQALKYLEYPFFEVLVIDDGSTDNTAAIVREYPVKLISTKNEGLSNARNTGLKNAKGEIIAYLDDDAYPDPQWLQYLASSFNSSPHAAIGGPNIIPENDGFIANCVALAPGGPIHVLLTDEIAEHIPGCNMAFRRECLMEINGFDPIFRSAGDDVDLCWRIQHTGRTIGFHPSALVWHHRRNSLKNYWKQQKGYGKAEALLEAKWPEKYNGLGHLSWAGRIYGNGVTLPISLKKDKIFYGTWGSAPFQSVYKSSPANISFIPLMPEWNLLVFILGTLCLLGISWAPLLWLFPLFVFTLFVVFLQAGISAAKALSTQKMDTRTNYFKHFLLITILHVIQPVARLYGRFSYGLTPWRKRGTGNYGIKYLFKHWFTSSSWSETWDSTENWLTKIEDNLRDSGARVQRGGQFDNWDLQVACGFFTAGRGQLTIEEHGANKQMLRFKCWTKYSKSGIAFILLMIAVAAIAIFDQAYLVSGVLSFILLVLITKYFDDTAMCMNELEYAFRNLKYGTQEQKEDGTTKVLVPEHKIAHQLEEA